MKRQTKIAILAIGSAALASATAAAVFTTVKILSDMAVKKDIPKVLKPLQTKVSGGFVPDENLLKIATERSLRLKQRCTEKVIIKNKDDLSLTAYWCRHPNPKRIIIAMHGWRSNWETDFSLIADYMYENQCSVLFPYQRCHGESEGEHIGFGVFERYDCVDWVNYVVQNEQNDLPVYLCGVSMGATTVLMASELDLPNRVKGIIADCGFTSPNEIWKHVIKNNLKIRGNLALNLANFYVSKEAKLDTKTVTTLNALANTNIPVLFVHGDKDSFVPIDMTYENYYACAGEKQLLIVEGAEHGLSFYVDPDTYKKTIDDFFKKYDN